MYNYCKTCCHDGGDIGFCDKCYYNHILEEKGIPPTEYEAKPKARTFGEEYEGYMSAIDWLREGCEQSEPKDDVIDRSLEEIRP